MESLTEMKQSLINEVDRRIADKVLEPNTATLLKKLIQRAETDPEALMIQALFTTYHRTGLHFEVRLENPTNDIHYFRKNTDLSFHIDDNKPTNQLIIGDNYHALQNLLIQYKGKIDIIYIDPPYGKDSMGEFAQTNYQNAITRDNLLSMLYPRLTLAKQLLSDNGVIFCSIDDKNQAYVKCLFDQVFGETNFICNFCYLQSGREYDIDDFADTEVKVLGANLGMFKSGVEYVLCYKRSADFKFALRKADEDEIDSRITKNGNNISELNFPKGLRFNGTEDKTFKDSVGGDREKIEILNKEGMIFKGGILQNDITLRSCFANPNMVQKFFAGENVIDNRGQKILEIYFTATGIPYMRKEKAGELPTNVLSGFGDTSIPRQMLIDILGGQYFDYPKPNNLISSLVELQENKDAIILDFFAGSGTTGHAVLELNRKDGGNRKFILCQLNEKTDTTPNGIAYDVTTKRLKRVMTGSCYDGTDSFKWIKDNEQYGGNLDVYEISTVSNSENTPNKTPFDVIDETLYGKKRFTSLQDKIDWVCTNFRRTQFDAESDEVWKNKVEENIKRKWEDK